MPLSKKRDAERKRQSRAAAKARSTALLPKSLARKLSMLGLRPERWLRGRPVSLDDYRDLERRYEAKAAHVEWQKGGIRMLHEEIATLRALLATQPAMQELSLAQRITQLEAEQALACAEEPQESAP